MSDATTPRTRTITLTDRPPVRIREDEWPVIAEAQGDSWAGHPGDGRYQQALSRGELAEWTLKVRQHEDGRTLVYGIFKAASFATRPGHDWRGGELLDPEGEKVNYPERMAQMPAWIVGAICRVGDNGNFPEHIVRECIADLPAVTI